MLQLLPTIVKGFQELGSLPFVAVVSYDQSIEGNMSFLHVEACLQQTHSEFDLL